MRAALLGLVLSLSACAKQDPASEVRDLRFRIDGAAERSARDLSEVRGTIGDSEIELAFPLPPSPSCSDPALLVDYASTLQSAEVDGQPIETRVRPLGLIPIPTTGPGSKARLVFRGPVERYQGHLYLGCERELLTSWMLLDLVQFVVGAAQFVAGVLLAAAALLQRQRSAYGWLALFLITTGIVFVDQSPGFRNLLLVDPMPLVWLRDVCCFVYTFAFVRFVVQAFGDTPRRLFAKFGYLALGTGGIAALLDGARLVAFTRMAPLSQLIALAALPIAVAHTLRLSARGDRAARRFLAGIVALLVFSTPDLLWGLGLPYHFEFNTAPVGLLVFAASMAWIIDWRFEEKGVALARSNQELEAHVNELERKTREVVGLNKELRHQIEQRSRELGKVLAAGAKSEVPRMHVLDVGERLGRYRVLGRLGKGGMGAVYEVERVTDEARFALKVMTSASTPELAARFAREAEVAAKVSHENVISIADVAILDSGMPYLVMELVRGGDLESLRARFGDVLWALDVLAQIAAGLEALHERGVIHRDLKPANVLISPGSSGPVAKLADFGIARDDDVAFGATLGELDATQRNDGATPARSHTRAIAASENLTQTGALIGTPLYMAPELGRGARATQSSDVFAFGIVAFEACVGRYPFATPPAFTALTKGTVPEPPAFPPEVPDDVRDLLGRALSLSPTERPSARMLALALKRHRSRSVA